MGGGHQVMRGLNATNAMFQGLIKTSSALLPRSGHAHMHLCDGTGGFVGGDEASKQHRDQPVSAYCLGQILTQK